MISETLSPSSYFVNPYAIPHVVVSALLLVLGIFIYRQNRTSLINLSYLFATISTVLWLLGDALVMSSKAEAAALFCIKFVYIGITFIPASLYFFCSAWLNIFEQKKKWILFNYLLGLVFIILFFATDKFVVGYRRHFFGNFSVLGKFSFLYLLYFFGVTFAFFKNLVTGYCRETAEVQKIQKKHLLIAFFIAFIGATEFLPTFGISIYPIGFFTLFVFNLIVAHTIIRYKLLDIETVFHKTFAWLITNLALIIPFVLLGYFIRSWYSKLALAPAVAFLGGILLIFLFYIKLFQSRVDNFFQRRRYNLEEIAIQFTEDLVHLRSLNQLIQRIEKTIADTLYPQTVGIFIYNDNVKNYRLANPIAAFRKVMELRGDDQFLLWLVKNDRIAYREFVDIDPVYAPIRDKAKGYFALTEATVVIPLVLNERLLGIINLGKKANLSRYNAVDFQFLSALKNQSTIAISNSLLYENMEEQVRQRTQELVEVQKQLIQAEKLATVGTLAGGVAHEINNPLTAILTNVQMLLVSGGAIDAKLDRQSLELIEEATKRCRTIVQKLMTYAKKPLETTEVAAVDLLKVINNVVSFLNYQLEQDDIKMTFEAEKNNYITTGNQNELEQVVTNLVLNAKDAIKKIKKSGNIYIRLFSSNDWMNIEVKDDGSGISKEMITKIFDPFFTTKDVGKGTGLGLSICQAIIEKHKGRITLKSETNKGATFTIQLPKVYKSRLRTEPINSQFSGS